MTMDQNGFSASGPGLPTIPSPPEPDESERQQDDELPGQEPS